MSEQDLGLKVASRRLLWRMGYTTRLDVQLRGVWGPDRSGRTTDRARRGAQPESFTDLDVLGLGFTGGSRLHSAIVDCKTTPGGSTSRMFWVRGVADFFAADDAYMVRDSVVTDAARQLTTKLGITALTSEDLGKLEALHPRDLPLDVSPLARLFDQDSAAKVLAAFTGLDGRLKPLLDYREFGYWLYDEYRNPVQLVEHLRGCASQLDARNPRHLALVLDLTWLYLVTLTHAIHAIRAAHVADPDRGLQEYLFGGTVGLREKQQLAQLLEGLRSNGAVPSEVSVDLLPSYYTKLRELVIRIMRRPDRVLSALRLLELMTAVTALGDRVEPGDIGKIYDDVAAKQAADVVGFLVTTAGLNPGFRDRARSLLLGEPLPAPPT
ncbi:hypothetical protein ACTWLT_21415 [Micromonospora sp. ZYX-F-536]|uniref:hypothetical protein n=1 Tax=Micromonospora sp. ZYX-F-536 TaxID=3457629 RepID=UPI0040408DFC